MRWIKITILAILTILFARAVTAEADTLSQDSALTGNRLTTADAAIARALAYTGFDELESYSRSVEVTAEQMTVGEGDPEVLRAEFDGKQLWRVDFRDIAFDFAEGCKRDFEVYLDAEQGRLVHIWSCCQSGGCNTAINADWTRHSPEWQLENRRPSVEYLGLPPGPLRVRFLHVVRRLLSSDHNAKAVLITGLLVSQFDSPGKNTDVWFVTLSGMPGKQGRRGAYPSFLQLWADASTGAVYGVYKRGPVSQRGEPSRTE
jgi:hypothetical protein